MGSSSLPTASARPKTPTNAWRCITPSAAARLSRRPPAAPWTPMPDSGSDSGSALVLAIDLGSSWCKAAYVDPTGTLVAIGRAYTRSIKPALHGMGEQFWKAVIEAVSAANCHLPQGSHPSAITLSCRALHGISLDENGEEFFPTWDATLNRAAPEVQHAYSPAVWGDQDPYIVGYGMSVVSAA